MYFLELLFVSLRTYFSPVFLSLDQALFTSIKETVNAYIYGVYVHLCARVHLCVCTYRACVCVNATIQQYIYNDIMIQ